MSGQPGSHAADGLLQLIGVLGDNVTDAGAEGLLQRFGRQPIDHQHHGDVPTLTEELLGPDQTGPVGEEAGFNGYLLRTSSNPHYMAVDSKTIEAITLTTAATASDEATLRGVLREILPNVMLDVAMKPPG